MSHFLDRLNYFSNPRESFSGGFGVTNGEDRTWEDAYRNRWAHDKIVRSTHGVNCTGSCSWKIYVKGGIVTWETQQTDYPAHRAGTCPTTSRAAVRAERATAGICIAPIASSIRWCAVAC
jgi:nitrate reductase alpha subunit